jgi:hypothetical protein
MKEKRINEIIHSIFNKYPTTLSLYPKGLTNENLGVGGKRAITYDGSKFIIVTPDEGIFTSADGVNWTQNKNDIKLYATVTDNHLLEKTFIVDSMLINY